ncbi:GntR family transcriptional regulator [Terrilactibacillus sp. S3-3]|nr:GntR family transcriptional regulator [Terrilactibacillus sp. S3-3]
MRAVLQRLKYDSLIEIIPQKGAFVYCPSPKEAEQIFFVRQLLEPEAASLAAINATEKQLDRLYQLLEEEIKLYETHQTHKALIKTRDLHMTIIEASGNVYLIECLRKIISLSHIILAFYDISDERDYNAESEHSSIVDAIYNRNPSLVKELAYNHVFSIKRDIDFSKSYTRLHSFDHIINKYMV